MERERKMETEKEIEMETDKEKDGMESPTASQKTVSDDDEIDYSVKPEFYDENLDDKDEVWVQKKRKGRTSDAVLSCPACFTTLCLECQRYKNYLEGYYLVLMVWKLLSTLERLNYQNLPSISIQRGPTQLETSEPNLSKSILEPRDLCPLEIFNAALINGLCSKKGTTCSTPHSNLEIEILVASWHAQYVTQYRAIFVVNCKIKNNQVLRPSNQEPKNGRKSGRGRTETEAGPSCSETFKPVCCLVCSTEVGVIDDDEVYHFFNVLPSES